MREKGYCNPIDELSPRDSSLPRLPRLPRMPCERPQVHFGFLGEEKLNVKATSEDESGYYVQCSCVGSGEYSTDREIGSEYLIPLLKSETSPVYHAHTQPRDNALPHRTTVLSTDVPRDRLHLL